MTGHNDDEEDEEVFNATVNAARQALSELTPEPTASLRQVILCLRPEIRAKRAAGAKWPEIAESLKSAGIAIHSDTLRTYVNGKGIPSRAARSVTEKTRKKAEQIRRSDPSERGARPDFGETEASANGRPVATRRMK